MRTASTTRRWTSMAWVMVSLWAIVPAVAQTTSGAPGSPSATTTIQGDQIPAPPQKFGGVIKETSAQSKPCWPARVVRAVVRGSGRDSRWAR